jgi:crotonobetainyl-CoA:carnitine CoA-transferase CaiB-like acyl-CoA transferase
VTAPASPGGPRAHQPPPAPLRGVRVVELAHWMAGPAAGGVLADWGADVVKVEPPGGEPMRTIWGAMGASPDAPNGAFTSANRGKRSIELDLGGDRGREVLSRLLATADVLLTNLRPAALTRLGLAPEEVSGRYPRLV